MVISVLLALATTAFGYANNPPMGYAGNPPNNASCINCHSGNPLNHSSGSLTISGLPPSGYVPGTTYHLTVTQARSGSTRWGFELTAIYQSGSSWLQAGGLIVTDPTHTNLGVGTGTSPDYMRQTSSGSYPGTPGPTSWNFDWTAPNPAVGPIGIYASGAGTNGSGTSGDYCYTTSTTLNPNVTPPNLNVTMTPVNPPIVVPANGGSFNFDASVSNAGPSQTPFYAWARNRNPDGTYTGNLLGPVQINPPVGVTVTRTRTQVIPADWLAGVHYYIGYGALTIGYPAIDADSFAWTKSATSDGGPMVWEAVNYGEPFPGEEIPPLSRGVRGDLVAASPNPFNPTTAISYQLSDARHVSLKVYDIAGRLVATLVDGTSEAGTHQVTFDGSNLASGVYLYTLQAGSHTTTGKMVLMK
jgi:hypothetical protein